MPSNEGTTMQFRQLDPRQRASQVTVDKSNMEVLDCLAPSANAPCTFRKYDDTKDKYNNPTLYDPNSYIITSDGTFKKWSDLSSANSYKEKYDNRHSFAYKAPSNVVAPPSVANTISNITANNANITLSANKNTEAMTINVSNINGVNTVNSLSNINVSSIKGSVSYDTKIICNAANSSSCTYAFESADINLLNQDTIYTAEGRQLNIPPTPQTMNLTNIYKDANRVTVTGNTTFNGTTTIPSNTQFQSIATSGNVTVQNGVSNYKNNGLDLRSPLLTQFNYTTFDLFTYLQNIQLDWSQASTSLSVAQLSNFLGGTISSDIYNILSYNDNGTVLKGQDAAFKIGEWISINSALNRSSGSVMDVAYTINSGENQWNISNLIDSSSVFKNFDSTQSGTLFKWFEYAFNAMGATNRTVEKGVDLINGTLAASKSGNLAEYNAVYLKQDETKGYFINPTEGYKKSADSGNYYNTNLNAMTQTNANNQKEYVVDYYDVKLRAKDWSYEIQRTKDLIKEDVGKNMVPQIGTQTQMQSFVDAVSGRSANGFEASVGYKFRMFKSSFFTAPQFDISMFRNANSLMTGVISGQKYTYGNLDSSYAGSLVGKIGFENKLSLGRIKIPFSIYGFGGGTSALTTYREAKSQSFGVKYGIGAEVFISKQISLFGEMFRIDFLKQNINYLTSYSDYIASNAVKSYVNGQYGTEVVIDNSQTALSDNKNITVKYADLNQVLDIDNITYKTTEKFGVQNSITGVKFGVTYYIK
jgi:hypothetical protein